MPRSVWCGRQEWFQFSRQVRDALDNLPARNGGATAVNASGSGRETMLPAASENNYLARAISRRYSPTGSGGLKYRGFDV